MADTDWVAWHEPYDDPTSPLSRRLGVVQAQISDAFDRGAPGPLRVISVCAGQGRDLIGTLSGHPRAGDVTACLVEKDVDNAAVAERSARNAGLEGIEAIVADAGVAAPYRGAVPADVVLVCGVFGNISDSDIARTIAALPELCAPGASVIWTRHRRPPDRTAAVRSHFADAGFEELFYEAPRGSWFAVGTHRLTATPGVFDPFRRFFTFVGDGTLPA